MSADEVVREAIEELYGIDPDDFMQRRTVLASAARKTDKAVAKDIAALRKPTRSAYVLNRLVRSDPEAAQRLADLGVEMLAAQDALDGPRMRELSTLRRGLVEELADQSFGLLGQRPAPAALRDEVVSTLNAAVADESVVEQLRTGTLLRSARWDGFGFASPPELSVVRPGPRRPLDEPATRSKPSTPGTGSVRATKTRPAKSGETVTIKSKPTTKPATTARTKSKATTARDARSSADKRGVETAARAEAKAEARAAEQRRREALADAQRAVKDADSALAKAIKTEQEQQTLVRLLHEQLTDARRRLDEMRIDVRRAENRQRKAHNALERQ